MDSTTIHFIAYCVLSLGFATLSAWKRVNDKDGTTWGIVSALFLIGVVAL